MAEPTEYDEKTEKLISMSETAVWARYERSLPQSYRSSYTRRAHRAGFEAGIAFAQVALDQAQAQTDGSAT